jgi:ABC-type uncharacterized transport system permease subunit
MRSRLSSLFDALLPVLATLAALGVGAVMLLFLKVNPIEAYAALWDGAFGSTNALAETLVKATPLLVGGTGYLHFLPRRCDQHRRRRADDHWG